MSRHGAIELDFGDGTKTFRLGLDEIQELEEKVGAGIFTLARQLDPNARTCRTFHVTETIRIGLTGGGMKHVEALTMVRRYCDARPIDESRDVAYAVVMAALVRVHGDKVAPPGEAQAAETTVSTSPPSTPAQP